MSGPSQEELAKRLVVAINSSNNRGYNITKIRELISNITNLNRVIDGDTALTAAAENGLVDVVTALIEAGASLDVQDKDGRSALMIASTRNYKKDYKQIVHLLLEHGADTNLQDKRGLTALFSVCGIAYNDIDIVRLLLKHGATIDIQNNEGKSALMNASRDDLLDTVKLLLKRGANIDLRDNKGYTALIHATESGNRMIVRYLIKKGANLDVQDTGQFGRTALIMATARANLETVDLLLKHGANADIQDRLSGDTALMVASRGIFPPQLTIVKHLLKYGANKDIRNRMHGHTARDIAVASEQPDIVALLDTYEAQVNAASKLKNFQGVKTLRKKFNEKGAVPVPEDVETIISSFLTGHRGTLKQQRNSLARTLGRKSPPQYGPRRHPLLPTQEEKEEDAAEGSVRRKEYTNALNSHAKKSYFSGGRRTKHRALHRTLHRTLRPNKTRRRR